ncbi:MAG: phage holin family protein [Nitrospirales bacterium]
MRGFLIRCSITAVAVLLASQIIPGIEMQSFLAGMVAAVVLSFLNALVRPLLYLLSAPIILLSLGLFMVMINAFLLHVVSWFVKGFIVDGFWPAIGGAILISVVSAILNIWVSERGQVEVAMNTRPRKIRHIN